MIVPGRVTSPGGKTGGRIPVFCLPGWKNLLLESILQALIARIYRRPGSKHVLGFD
jgi:hypothetical protein